MKTLLWKVFSVGLVLFVSSTISSGLRANGGTGCTINLCDPKDRCTEYRTSIIYCTGGVCKGTRGDDCIIGTEGVDYIHAGKGDDIVCALGDDDYVYAGKGDDYVCGGEGGDVVEGGLGVDILYGEDGEDALNGGHCNDQLYAGDGDDDCYGGLGNDYPDGCDNFFPGKQDDQYGGSCPQGDG